MQITLSEPYEEITSSLSLSCSSASFAYFCSFFACSLYLDVKDSVCTPPPTNLHIVDYLL